MGHGVTLRAFLSPIRHMEQILFCDSPAGIGLSLRTDARTEGRREGGTEGWTDVKVEIVI